jgi:hypothetical protein
VAANDIGAINFLADIRNLDIYGLGSREVLAAKNEGHYNHAAISRLTADRDIAIVYDEWLIGGIPAEWTRVGQWTISDNLVAAYPTVSFYAIQPGEREGLARNLAAFSAALPGDVAVAMR